MVIKINNKKLKPENKKEIIFFLTNILTGFSSGLISGITITAVYRFTDKDYSLSNILTLSLGSVVSIGLIIGLIYLILKIKKA